MVSRDGNRMVRTSKFERWFTSKVDLDGAKSTFALCACTFDFDFCLFRLTCHTVDPQKKNKKLPQPNTRDRWPLRAPRLVPVAMSSRPPPPPPPPAADFDSSDEEGAQKPPPPPPPRNPPGVHARTPGGRGRRHQGATVVPFTAEEDAAIRDGAARPRGRRWRRSRRCRGGATTLGRRRGSPKREAGGGGGGRRRRRRRRGGGGRGGRGGRGCEERRGGGAVRGREDRRRAVVALHGFEYLVKWKGWAKKYNRGSRRSTSSTRTSSTVRGRGRRTGQPEDRRPPAAEAAAPTTAVAEAERSGAAAEEEAKKARSRRRRRSTPRWRWWRRRRSRGGGGGAGGGGGGRGARGRAGAGSKRKAPAEHGAGVALVDTPKSCAATSARGCSRWKPSR